MIFESSGECSLHLTRQDLIYLQCAVDSYILNLKEAVSCSTLFPARPLLLETLAKVRELSDSITRAMRALEEIQ